jgi:hypothetical protein
MSSSSSSSSSSNRPSSKRIRRTLSDEDKQRNRDRNDERYRAIRDSYKRDLSSHSSSSSSSSSSHSARIAITHESAIGAAVRDVKFTVIDGDKEDPEPFERTLASFRAVTEEMVKKEIIKMLETNPAIKFHIRIGLEIRKYDENTDRVKSDGTVFLVSNTIGPVSEVGNVQKEVDTAYHQIE